MSFLNRVHNPHNYDPTIDIPSLSGKVIIVTGGNVGLGKETIRQLVAHNPARLYLTARTQAKYESALTDVLSSLAPQSSTPVKMIEFLELDLSSFASIKRAADSFRAANDRLDILVNNAGIMGAPSGLTSDGYEVHFGTNHLGHALFTKLLMPVLLQTAAGGSEVRVVTVSSVASTMGPAAGFLPDQVVTDMASSHMYTKYGQSKLANVLFAKELARRYPQIVSVAVHPGRVATGLLDVYMEKPTFAGYFQKFYDAVIGALTLEQGAWSQLWAATWERKADDDDSKDEDKVVSGKYYVPVGKVEEGDKRFQDEALMAKLWDWQEEQFKKHGYA